MRYSHWIPNRADSTARTFVQRVAPMYLAADDTPWSAVCDAVSSMKHATERSRSATKYRAEFIVPHTPYKDDLRLTRHPDGRIDIISSSRIPGFDWGVNRVRVRRVRRILRRKGLVR